MKTSSVTIFSVMMLASIGSSMAGGSSGGGQKGGNGGQTSSSSPQTQTQTGIQIDRSASTSISRSASTGGAATGGTANGTVNGSTNGTANGTNTLNVNNANGANGGYSPSTIRNTPDVIAPNINGGGVCNVGVSGGFVLPGFGVVGGGTWEGPKCELRMQVALLANIGQLDAAMELLCWDNMVLRNIRAAQAHPCLQDRIRFAQMGIPGYVLLVPVSVGPPMRRRQ